MQQRPLGSPRNAAIGQDFMQIEDQSESDKMSGAQLSTKKKNRESKRKQQTAPNAGDVVSPAEASASVLDDSEHLQQQQQQARRTNKSSNTTAKAAAVAPQLDELEEELGVNSGSNKTRQQ